MFHFYFYLERPHFYKVGNRWSPLWFLQTLVLGLDFGSFVVEVVHDYVIRSMNRPCLQKSFRSLKAISKKKNFFWCFLGSKMRYSQLFFILRFKIIVLARMSPLPYSLVNGLFGLTNQVTFITYALATFLGMWLENITAVVYGTTIRDLTEVIDGGESPPAWKIVMSLFQVTVLAIIVLIVTIYVRRALRLDEDPSSSMETNQTFEEKTTRDEKLEITSSHDKWRRQVSHTWCGNSYEEGNNSLWWLRLLVVNFTTLYKPPYIHTNKHSLPSHHKN